MRYGTGGASLAKRDASNEYMHLATKWAVGQVERGNANTIVYTGAIILDGRSKRPDEWRRWKYECSHFVTNRLINERTNERMPE